MTKTCVSANEAVELRKAGPRETSGAALVNPIGNWASGSTFGGACAAEVHPPSVTRGVKQLKIVNNQLKTLIYRR